MAEAKLLRQLRAGGHRQVVGVSVGGRSVVIERDVRARGAVLASLARLGPGRYTLDEVGRMSGYGHLPDPAKGARGAVLWAAKHLGKIVRLDGDTVVILQKIS